MRRVVELVSAALLALPVVANADIRGPEGDRGFGYVYPANASPAPAATLHRDDLKQIAAEGAKL